MWGPWPVGLDADPFNKSALLNSQVKSFQRTTAHNEVQGVSNQLGNVDRPNSATFNFYNRTKSVELSKEPEAQPTT